MTAVTESGLKRLEELIINGQKVIETRLTTIETDLKIGLLELKGEIKAVDVKINGLSERIKPIDKISDLSEKVGELKNWRSIALIILGAIVG